MKVLINSDYGGFSLSDKFLTHLKNIKLINEDTNNYHINRHDQLIIEEAIKFGLKKVNGICADLEIVELPDNCNYKISEYDGQEWIEQYWIDVTLDDLKNGLSDEQLSMVTRGCDIKLIRE